MNADKSYKILVEVTKMLTENQIPYWLDGGTLLGIYRDKKIIGYDDDMDLGTYEMMFTRFYMNRIIKLMSDLGWESTTSHSHKLRFRHQNGASIDFFKFEKTDKYYWHYCHSGFMYYSLELFDSLSEIEIDGVKFSIPNNTEKYLKEVYGESWMFPIVDFKKPRDYCNYTEYKNDIEKSMTKKVLIFDVDGTLTQPRKIIDNDTKAFLIRLAEKYRTYIAGAGSCERIYNQLDDFNGVLFYGNYGLSSAIGVNGRLKYLYKERIETQDKERLNKVFNEVRNKYDLKKFTGDSYEIHDTGIITFALLGTKADIEDKMKFDIDKQKRRKIHPDLMQQLPDLNVLIGGTSSFDILPSGYDKSYAVNKILDKHKNISKKDIVFIGDDWDKTGNDYGVKKTGIRCVKIENASNMIRLIRFFLENQYRLDRVTIPGEL
jgi:HAD superfamily hydrolase (TIGR01484 family)